MKARLLSLFSPTVSDALQDKDREWDPDGDHEHDHDRSILHENVTTVQQ